jgi:hypothetical protein
MTHEDRDLQTWFETLREGDRTAAPAFEALLQRKAEGLGLRRLAAAFVLVIIVLLLSLPRKPLPIEQLSQWRSPTASLLDVPKSPLLTTAPSITR